MDCVRYDAPEFGGIGGAGESTTINVDYSSKSRANLSSGSIYFFVSSFPAVAICFTTASASAFGMAIDKLY